jgi:hypothetical protein
MDLRLIGAFPATDPAELIARARTFAAAALCGLAATGFFLFSAEASHVAMNPVFQIKMLLVAAGLANIAMFQFVASRQLTGVPPGAPMPRAARIAGYSSLVIWFAVAACGRAIAYF